MKLRCDRVLCDYFDNGGDQRGRLSPAISIQKSPFWTKHELNHREMIRKLRVSSLCILFVQCFVALSLYCKLHSMPAETRMADAKLRPFARCASFNFEICAMFLWSF